MIIFLILAGGARSQGNFKIENNKSKFELPFQLVSDLVIIPLKLNGVELSFLLDTGVDSTILFSLDKEDSVEVQNASVIYLRGMGEGEPIRALKSTGNSIRVGDAYSNDLSIYISFDYTMNLSNRLGIVVNGIIGYDFFKDFVLEFNYSRKKLTIYNKDRYSPKRCRRCDILPLTFSKNKPYVDAVTNINGTERHLNFLIDSGSGDALWLFKDDEAGIKLPEKHFDDFLGFGMGGSVYGARSRVNKIELGKFTFENVTASFPDTLYISGLKSYDKRNGSIGAKILKRFDVIFDYSSKTLSLKPNRNYNNPFEYDMSGVVVAHDGYSIIKESVSNNIYKLRDAQNSDPGIVVYKSQVDVKFRLEPQYKIVEVRPDSPAALAGLKKGDILLDINKKPSYNYSLSEIHQMLSSKDGKKIKLKIQRGLLETTISFRLKRML